MKKTDVIKLLGMLAAAYPNMKEVDEVMVEVWYSCLKDISVKEGLANARGHIITSPFPPTIADILGETKSNKNKFHNFKQYSSKFTAEEIEEICRKKRESYYRKLGEKKELLDIRKAIGG